MPVETNEPIAGTPLKSDERLAIFLLIVVLAPALSIAVVGSYGFIIWMSQLLFGPPGS